MLEEKIYNYAKNDFAQRLSSEQNFFFQKGQDALNKWIDMELSAQQTDSIISLSLDYNEFKKIDASSGELFTITQLLFEIVSYCDNKANGKKHYNQYDDSRTFANAGVRMGVWIKNLVEYKFNPQNVTGSIKNAFNYLLDPTKNTTILSENHRKLIVEYYLKKDYNPADFTDDCKNIFKNYTISVLNDANYTFYISSLIYNLGDEWKPKINLSFKDLVKKLEKHFISEKVELSFAELSSRPRYVWISNKSNSIGNAIAHYEIGFRSIPTNKDKIYVDLHFESPIKAEKDVFKNTIESLPENLYWFNWQGSNSIGFKDFYKLDEDDIVDNITAALEYIEENIGDSINAIINKLSSSTNNTENKLESMKLPLNQILYGPPGTGKTFNSINEALKIVDPIFYQTNKNDRKKLTERFKELLIKNSEENKGQIAFCTFHQSFSYEDFVEGIKPKTTEEKNVYYDVEPGIFKRICQLANSNNSTVKVIKEGKISWSEEEFKKASFFKLSLGNYQNPMDRPIYEYCRDNGYIAIGFGQENDFTGLSDLEVKEKCDLLQLEITAAQQMNYFIHFLKKDNYIMVSNGNKYIRALGRVIGDYEYFADSPIHYNHFRKVEWLFVDENIPIDEIYERGLSQKTMYKMDDNAFREDFFTNKGQQQVIENKIEKKYVLIIDEINRGNVSSIFGELITLIEEEKRAGKDEELEVILPYSKEVFKVPSNIYIIGTMNTADRSVEALDAALRRRFCFEEMPPLYHLEGLQNEIFGHKAFKILKKINLRIEKLLDKDHKIGHSYFLNKDENSIIDSFYKNIIPLLQEYFFGDYSKIGLVLGKGFVSLKESDSDIFAEFDEAADNFEYKNLYEIIDYRKVENYKLTINKVEIIMDFGQAIQTLMNK